MEKLTKVWKKIKGWDFTLLAASFLLMFYSENIVTFFFPFEPSPGRSYLYVLANSLTIFFFIISTCYLTYRLFYTPLYRFFEKDFENDFKYFTSWQKTLLSFGAYFFLVVVFVLILLSQSVTPVM